MTPYDPSETTAAEVQSPSRVPETQSRTWSIAAFAADAADEPHSTVLATYRELIALRKARPELSNPWLDEVDVDVDDDARTIVLHRGGLRLAVNLGDDPVTFDLGLPVGRVLLASEPVEVDEDALTVGPESFVIAELG